MERGQVHTLSMTDGNVVVRIFWSKTRPEGEGGEEESGERQKEISHGQTQRTEEGLKIIPSKSGELFFYLTKKTKRIQYGYVRLNILSTNNLSL